MRADRVVESPGRRETTTMRCDTRMARVNGGTNIDQLIHGVSTTDRQLPHRRGSLRIIALVAFVASAFFTCFGQPAQAASEKLISSPGTFKDDFDSRLATDGTNLWLAVVGMNRSDELRSQVFIRRRGAWRRLPGQPLSPSNAPLQLEALRVPGQKRSVPCLGDSSPEGLARIRCLEHGRWRSVPIARSLRRMMLVNLSADGRSMTALFSDLGGKPQALTARVAKLRRGRIVSFGPPIKPGVSGTANLGSKTGSTRSIGIDVAVETFDKRWVFTLGREGWTRSRALPDSQIGSQWGTVRSSKGLFYPVMSVGEDDWPFSIYRGDGAGPWTELVGSPLNVGSGKAQGVLDAVGDRVWAMWQQHGTQRESDGLFPTEMYAGLIGREGEDVERKIQLWKGPTIGPGSLQVLEYRGRPVFMYPRQFRPKGGLHTTVDFSQR